MKSKVFVIHKAIAGIVFLVLGISLIHFIIVWKDMPQEIGMHFDGEGNFDVYESKNYGFYPYVISTVIISALLLGGRFVKKVNTGIPLSEKGDLIFRNIILFAFDAVMIYMCIFALFWSRAVEKQHPLKIGFLSNVLLAIFAYCLLITPIALVTVRRRYAPKSKAADKNTSHKIDRMISLALSCVSVPLMIVLWERLPSGKPTTDPFATVYFADLHIHAPKIFCITPVVLCFVLFFAGELIIKKLGDKKGANFVKLVDDLRGFLTVMLFTRLLFDHEYAYPPGPALVFLALITAAIIRFIITKKRSPR